MKSLLKRKTSLSCCLLAAALILLGAAADETRKVIYKGPRGPRELQTEPSKQPEAKPKEVYAYNPEGKTDPFKSFLTVKEVVPQAGAEDRPKTYLETLDLSQLDLIAVVLSPKGNWAMVRDAKGMGFPVAVGTPIGLNGGIILSISDGKMVVREKYKDFRGRLITRDIEKKLYKD